jgi:deoxyribodipyrimidine photo-lyase
MAEPETEVKQKPRVLIYLLQQDVRLSDNPIFHAASLQSSIAESSAELSDTPSREDSLVSTQDEPYFTHFLPVYIFPANQIEVSGFLADSTQRNPYPEARSRIAGLWRTGVHRAKFMAEGVWDLKEKLESLGCGSGLELRVGRIEEVVEHMLDEIIDGDQMDVAGVWMTSQEGTEEKCSRQRIKNITAQRDIDFKLWEDVKYYIDE